LLATDTQKVQTGLMHARDRMESFVSTSSRLMPGGKKSYLRAEGRKLSYEVLGGGKVRKKNKLGHQQSRIKEPILGYRDEGRK